jgi:hypothetical protein
MNGPEKKVTPAWIAVLISVVSIVLGVIAYVRAGDLSAIHENTQRIDKLQYQVAELVQGESDLVSTIDMYLKQPRKNP